MIIKVEQQDKHEVLGVEGGQLHVVVEEDHGLVDDLWYMFLV